MNCFMYSFLILQSAQGSSFQSHHNSEMEGNETPVKLIMVIIIMIMIMMIRTMMIFYDIILYATITYSHYLNFQDCCYDDIG